MMKTFALFAFVSLSMTGCYQKFLVLQSDVVSMTKQNSGPVKKLKTTGPVKAKWCMGDKVLVGDEDNVGLVDQVVYKAQAGGKDADFITDVRVFRDTKGCALLSGTKAKMK